MKFYRLTWPEKCRESCLMRGTWIEIGVLTVDTDLGGVVPHARHVD